MGSDFFGAIWRRYEGPAERDDKVFPANKGGETEGYWSVLRINGPTKSGNCWKLKLTGKFRVVIRLNTRPGSLDFVDRFGRSPLEHEKVHEYIHKEYFNEAARFINPIEGYYCSKECAVLAKGWGYQLLRSYKHAADYDNSAYDILAYGANRRAEAQASLQLSAQMKANAKATARELNRRNCRVYKKCPL